MSCVHLSANFSFFSATVYFCFPTFIQSHECQVVWIVHKLQGCYSMLQVNEHIEIFFVP